MSNLILILALAFAQNALGQSICDKFGNYIDTKADIAAISHCSVLTGGLGIDYTFVGSAVFPGLTEVRSFWAGNPGASHSTPTMGETKVSYISFPDLVTAGGDSGGFQISGAPHLYKLDLPKFKTVNGALQISGTALTSISLPSLETINGGRAYFTGDFTEISLPNLKTARTISITTTGALDCSSLWAQLKGINWTDEDTEYFPAFTCKSSKGEVKSPLTAGSSSSSIHPTTTALATSSTQIPSSTTTTSKILSESSSTVAPSSTPGTSSTTVTSKAPITTSAAGSSSITTTFTVSSTLAPIGSNSTMSLRTSSTTTRSGSATFTPAPAQGFSAGNVVVAGAWSYIAAAVAVSVGLLLQ